MHPFNVTDLIGQHAASTPAAVAIVDRGRTFTYGELDRLVRQTAAHLRARGAAAGDRIGIALKDDARHLVAFLAVARLGAVAAPLDWRARPDERARLAAAFALSPVLVEPDAAALPGAATIAVDEAWEAAVVQAPADGAFPSDAGAPFQLAMTSGTSGPPKGVVITHGQQLMRYLAMHATLGAPQGLRYLSVTPLCFAAGRTQYLYHLLGGNTVLLYSPLFTADEFVAAVESLRADYVFTVPTVVRWLLDLPRRREPLLPGLRFLFTGGAPIAAAEKLRVLGTITPRYHELYGTSAAGIVSILRPQDIAARGTSVGRPLLLTEVEMVDDIDKVVPAGSEGFLRCRGAGVGTPLAAAADDRSGGETFRDGWYYPGEIALRDEAGFIHLKGRSSSIIIRAGVNIHPDEIEQALAAHPAVVEAAVAGLPSAALGEEVGAFVVARGEAQPDDLIAHCRRRLSPHKVPVEIFLVERLPRLSSGKLDRKAPLAGLAARRPLS